MRCNPPEWSWQPKQPLTLFHGTASYSLASIEAHGLVPGRRGPWHWRQDYEHIVQDEEQMWGVELLSRIPRFVIQGIWLHRIRHTKDLVYFGTTPRIAVRNGLAGLEAEWALRDNLRSLAAALRAGYSPEEWTSNRRPIRSLRPTDISHDWTVQDEILWRRGGHLVLTVWDVPLHALGTDVARHEMDIYRRRVKREQLGERRGFDTLGAEVKTQKAIPPQYLLFSVHLDRPKGREVNADQWRDWVTGITPGPGYVEDHPALSLDPEVVGA